MGNNPPTATIELGGLSYQVERTLGKGAYGKVQVLFPPRDHSHLPMLVVKRMHKQLLIDKGSQVIQALRFEKHILSNLTHPLLVNLHATLQNENELFMILDLMAGGDLSYWLNRERKAGSYPIFTEERVRFYAACLLLSLAFFHENGIVHRDIKPDNIMLCGKGYAHLTDLNVSKQLDPKTGTTSGFAGSPTYIAPEMFRRENYSASVDMWSLGATLFEMLFGRVPWCRAEHGETLDYLEHGDVHESHLQHAKGDPNYERMIKRILREKISWPSKSGMSDNCKNFITRLLCPESRRLSASAAMKHPWFEGLDWDALFRMEIPAPFVPNTDTANADAHHMFEEVMGPKVRFRKLTDAEQAYFHDWDWVRQGQYSDGPELDPKHLKKSLLRTTKECKDRQRAFADAGIDLPDLKTWPPFEKSVAVSSSDVPSPSRSAPDLSAAKPASSEAASPAACSAVELPSPASSAFHSGIDSPTRDQASDSKKIRRSRKKAQ